MSVSSYCITADLSGAPGCSPLCGIWGESVQIYEEIVCEREREHMWVPVCYTPSALRTFVIHISPLPVVYPDLREILSNSLFVSFKILFKSRC